MPTTPLLCKATLLKSLKKGKAPMQCSHKAKDGTDYCGRHKKFVVSNDSSTAPPPPPPPHSSIPNNTDCTICLNSIENNFTVTPCNHYFHSDCLKKWSKRANTCPCCRFALSSAENTTVPGLFGGSSQNSIFLRQFALMVNLQTWMDLRDSAIIGSDDHVRYSRLIAIRNYEDSMNSIY